MAVWQGFTRHREVFLIDSKIAIFADDSKLYKIISKTSDKISLQQDDSALQLETHLGLAMSLGIQKCKTLNISSKKLLSNREYRIDGTLLTTASKTIDLGITITDNLQWSELINQIFLRENHTLINKPYCQPLFGKWARTPPPNRGWRHEFAIVNNNTNQIVACSNQPGSIYLFSSSRIQTADEKALFGVVCDCVLEYFKLKNLWNVYKEKH